MAANPASPPMQWPSVPLAGTPGDWRHTAEAQLFGSAGAASCLTPEVLECLHRVLAMPETTQMETPSQLGTTEQELQRAALLRRNIELKNLLGDCLSALSLMTHKECQWQASSQQLRFQIRFAMLLHRLKMKQTADIELDEAASLHADSSSSSGADASAGSSNFMAQSPNESSPSSSHLHYVPVPVPATHQVPLPTFEQWKQIDGLIEAVEYSHPNPRPHVHTSEAALDECIPIPRFVNMPENDWAKIQRDVVRNDWAFASAQGRSFVGSIELSL